MRPLPQNIEGESAVDGVEEQLFLRQVLRRAVRWLEHAHVGDTEYQVGEIAGWLAAALDGDGVWSDEMRGEIEAYERSCDEIDRYWAERELERAKGT